MSFVVMALITTKTVIPIVPTSVVDETHMLQSASNTLDIVPTVKTMMVMVAQMTIVVWSTGRKRSRVIRDFCGAEAEQERCSDESITILTATPIAMTLAAAGMRIRALYSFAKNKLPKLQTNRASQRTATLPVPRH